MFIGFVRFCIVLAAVATVAPSPAAVDPVLAPTSAFLDDDFAGSGLEAKKEPRRQTSRRPIRRLRLIADADRAALLRAAELVPALLDECFPEIRGSADACAMLVPLMRARFEDRTMALGRLAAESGLTPQAAETSVRILITQGLVAYASLNLVQDVVLVAPTSEFYRRSLDFIERLNAALAEVVIV